MEIILILLVFGVSYALHATMDTYIYYSKRDGDQDAGRLGHFDSQEIKIVELAALWSKERILYINSDVKIYSVFKGVSEEFMNDFRLSFLDEIPWIRSSLEFIFRSDSDVRINQELDKLPKKVFVKGERFGVEYKFDRQTRIILLYLSRLNDDISKAAESVGTPGARKIASLETLLSEVDEHIEYVISKAIKNNDDQNSIRGDVVQELEAYVVHIQNYDIPATSRNLVALIEEMKNYSQLSGRTFSDVFDAKRLYQVTSNDRKRIQDRENRPIEIIQNSKMQVLAELSERIAEEKDADPLDVIAELKKEHANDFVRYYVQDLMERGQAMNRKLSAVKFSANANSEQMNKAMRVLPAVLPMIESMLLAAEQEPSKRSRHGKSEYAQIAVVIEGDGNNVRIRLISDNESMEEDKIKIVSEGNYIRVRDGFQGKVARIIGDSVPNLKECYKAINAMGGQIEFKVVPLESSEYIFTLPIGDDELDIDFGHTRVI